MRTADDLALAAAASGLNVSTLELVPVSGGGTEIAARLTFDDPWAAARLLLQLSEEDASDPTVRAWALDMLRATADAIGEPGPTVTPELRDATARTIHANVQSLIHFVHEPLETFQSARVTMQTEAGDCDDQARLVYALARAAAVPVELVFFEEDDQPIHVVARMQDADGIWQWAETTIDADYGEDPHEALARLRLEGGADPFARSMGAPGSPTHNIATPADVLVYRRVWDPYVLGVVRAAVACAEALESAAAAPGEPNADTLRLSADTERANADALLTRWNLHANTPDYQILINAAEILQDQQDAVLKAGQVYGPQVKTDCPAIALPAPPGVELQAGIIGQIEGVGILAHGVLQLLGAGVSGALDTLGPIVSPSPAALSTVSTIAIAAAVVAGALAVRELAKAAR